MISRLAGLPLITPRLQGMSEAVLDGETRLGFEPGNAESLADSSEMLFDQPALATEYGWRGRERCERDLNLEVQRDRFLTVVRHRLNG